MRGLLLDVRPLRLREFRLLYLGQLVSTAGSMLTYVALPYQTYALTHSSFAVGMIGVAEFVPVIALALPTGALADAVDRRRLIVCAETGASLRGIREGWAYAWSRQELVGSYVIDINAMLFGMPLALFRAIAASSWRSRAWRSRAAWTRSPAFSAGRCGTRRSRTACAA